MHTFRKCHETARQVKASAKTTEVRSGNSWNSPMKSFRPSLQIVSGSITITIDMQYTNIVAISQFKMAAQKEVL